MRTTTNSDTRTETFKHVLENSVPDHPSNVTLTLTLLHGPGGEMYGM